MNSYEVFLFTLITFLSRNVAEHERNSEIVFIRVLIEPQCACF